MAPMTSAHGVTSAATCTLSTSTRNASTSMSKRAPSAETVRVRRATQPSTPSSASATDGQQHERRDRDRPAADPVHDQRGHAADERAPGPA